MEADTQPHRKTLGRICTLGRVAGWGMIALGFLSIGSIYFYVAGFVGPDSQTSLHEVVSAVIPRVLSPLIDHFLTGLLVLGMVQLVRYAMAEGTEPRWLLRKGHIILSVFAVSLLLAGLLHNWSTLRLGLNEFPRARMLFTVTSALLPTLAKTLCVLGLAALIRAVLPILAESKTLV